MKSEETQKVYENVSWESLPSNRGCSIGFSVDELIHIFMNE